MHPPSAAQPPRLGFPESVGFGALFFFTFAVFSSVPDFIPGLRSIRPSLIAAFVGLLAVGISGRIGVLLRNKIAIFYLGLTIWFLLCVPFSVWPGGAVSTIVGPWLVALMSLFLVGGLIWNVDQFRRIVNLIGYSAVILSIIALALNQLNDEDRLMLQNSRYGNPNELSMIVLAALPFLAYMAIRRGNGIRRIIAVFGFPPILMVIAKTGSRAAMIGAVVSMLAVFLNVGMAQKVKLIVLGSAALAIVLIVLPSRTTDRFITIFGDNTAMPVGGNDEIAAAESAAARRMLLMDSITLTLRSPLFGVGPGNFPIAQDTLARARGESMGNWHLTHNTYTQYSSEAGVPSLLLFLAALVTCFRSISRTMKAPVPPGSVEWQDLRMIAFALRISLIAFLTCAFFDSLAYSPTVAVLLGLSISLEYCTKNLQVPVVAPPAPSPRGPQMVRTWQRPPLQTAPPRRLPGRV